jgi:exo-1,4-beta-D-glucosaminidase
VQYSYDDRSVVVVNSRYQAIQRVSVTATVYDFTLQKQFSKEASVDVGPDAVVSVFTLPDDIFNAPSPVDFLALTLKDADRHSLSRNFYWLSAKKTVYDWGSTTYQFTSASSYEDFTALQSLPKAGSLDVSVNSTLGGEGAAIRVKLKNPSGKLAFQVQLALEKRDDDTDILPVVWEDNYIELLPGEERDLTAKIAAADVPPGGAQLRIAGWNINTSVVPIKPSVGALPGRP